MELVIIVCTAANRHLLVFDFKKAVSKKGHMLPWMDAHR